MCCESNPRARSNTEGPHGRTTTGTDPATANSTLVWSFDQTAIDTEAATDGWYALLTNLPDIVDAAQVLRRYKGRQIQPVEAFDSTSSVNNSDGLFQL